ncbi:SUN domain-containing protein 2-like [Trachinotus anak]|uniref:SUN domain-containing protein 2-like n=1 Tax=Trachinotus anak TaxID=443729 RepID=UPI0039F20370
MSRKSSRLEAAGYYGTDGYPVISYRETIYRIFRRRRSHHHSQPGGGDSQPREGEPQLSEKAFQAGGRGSQPGGGDSQPRGEETSSSGNGNSRFIFIILPLCFGLVYSILTLNSNYLNPGLSESPVSPIITTTDPTAPCKDLEKQMGELQEELQRLQKEMNYLFPAADSLPNFALKSLGAIIVPHLSSETYQTQETGMTLSGLPLKQPPVDPGTVIQGHSALSGRCWAFAGGKGHLVIALSHPVTITHVTLDHIPKNLSPTGSITSAPKEFTVYGLENLDDEGTRLGTYLYDQEGDPVQIFKTADNEQGVFKYVKLQVNSNWGHPHHSCLYSFRVHGKLAE